MGHAGNLDGDDRAAAERAFDIDRASVRLEDLSGNREPESTSIRFGREERLENVRHVFRRNALALVPYRQSKSSPASARRGLERHRDQSSPRTARLDGVTAEIQDCLVERYLVPCNVGARGVQVLIDFELGMLHSKPGRDLFDDRRHANGFPPLLDWSQTRVDSLGDRVSTLGCATGLLYGVYADSCGLKTAFLGNGGRKAATIFSLRYSSSR